jgi:hypothetical protein
MDLLKPSKAIPKRRHPGYRVALTDEQVIDVWSSQEQASVCAARLRIGVCVVHLIRSRTNYRRVTDCLPPRRPVSVYRRGLIAEIKASKEPTKVLAERLGCTASNVSEPCSAGSAARASEGREACLPHGSAGEAHGPTREGDRRVKSVDRS